MRRNDPLKISERWLVFVMLPLIVASALLAIIWGITIFTGSDASRFVMNAFLFGVAVYLAAAGVRLFMWMSERWAEKRALSRSNHG